jgi:hypothetical protein
VSRSETEIQADLAWRTGHCSYLTGSARRLVADVPALLARVQQLTEERNKLQELFRIVAPSAVQYGARVYHIEQFPELLPYLSEEDLRRNQERPSAADDRVAVERDRLRAALDKVRATVEAWPSDHGRSDYASARGQCKAAVLAALADAGVPEPATDRQGCGCGDPLDPHCDFG